MNSSVKVWMWVLLSMMACNQVNSKNEQSANAEATAISKEFTAYWYGGEGEISHYDLYQARYGEMRKGSAILVFVTEDFLPDVQVKHERGDMPKISVLKLNLIKKFVTGIYEYSMMTTIFKPVDHSQYLHALKVTTSSQEWCGHTYTQINNRGKEYNVESHSYFQKEADQTFTMPVVWLEDELWNTLRLNPAKLPTGDINIIPSTMSSRLTHIPLKTQRAKATLQEYNKDDMPGSELQVYTLKYTEPVRELNIIFESEFPYSIAGWTETYKDGWNENAPELTTKAVRASTIKSAYWNQHGNKDEVLREKLNLR